MKTSPFNPLDYVTQEELDQANKEYDMNIDNIEDKKVHTHTHTEVKDTKKPEHIDATKHAPAHKPA